MDRNNYNIYLNSPEWNVVRRIALDFADYKCQACNHNRDLQVHHRTYENFGAETLTDVIVLCRQCHKLFHRVNEKQIDRYTSPLEAITKSNQHLTCQVRNEKYEINNEQTEGELRQDFKDIIENCEDMKGRRGINRVLIREMMISLKIDLKYHTKLCNVLDEEKLENISSSIDYILSV